jgi:hypothetical protein
VNQTGFGQVLQASAASAPRSRDARAMRRKAV